MHHEARITLRPTWAREKLDALCRRFEGRPPEALLDWTFDTFGGEAVMGTGFGYSGVALMHLLATVRPGATVFYLDTDLLFPQTYALRDQLAERLDVSLVRVRPELSLGDQASRHGSGLWNSDPDRCCFLRKVQPLQRYLAGKAAWVTALRRDQSVSRANTRLVEWNDINGVVKVNPLAAWTNADVWRYIYRYDLPYNKLHDDGYPSIGCMPCTYPVAEYEDERAGRWSGHAKTECGLHVDEPSRNAV